MDLALPTLPLPENQRSSAISRFMVQTLTTHAGRGPEVVRSHISADVVTVVMRNSLCQAERTVVEAGHFDVVVTSRRAVQASIRDELVAGVEAITGRHVAAFLSDHDVRADISVEAFVLD